MNSKACIRTTKREFERELTDEKITERKLWKDMIAHILKRYGKGR